MDTTKPLARTEKLILQEFANEVLVYDEERHKAHALNPAAALVWKHCDGRTTVPELAALLHHDLGLPEEEEIAQLALKRLHGARLLCEPVDVQAQGTSRREVLRKMSTVAGLAALLPVVTSIVALTPAGAATQVYQVVAQGDTSPKGKTCLATTTCCTNQNRTSFYACIHPNNKCETKGC